MSDIKFNASGILFFPDLGKDNQVTGPFPGLSLSAKKKVKDVEFVLSVPTAKAAKDKTLNGTVLSLRGTHSKTSALVECSHVSCVNCTSALRDVQHVILRSQPLSLLYLSG